MKISRTTPGGIIATAALVFLILFSQGCGKLASVESESESDSVSDDDDDNDNDSSGDSDSDADSDKGDSSGCVLDTDANLCWQEPKSDDRYPWYEAIDYCNDLDLGGSADSVLPTRQDFIDMLGGCDSSVLSGSDGYCNSCAESTTCTALFGTDNDDYWSSSPYEIGSGQGWFVDFYQGHVYGWVGDGPDNDVPIGHFIRCVRSGP